MPFFRALDALVGTITCVAKLPVLRHMTVSTQGHEIPECIVTLLAPSDLVMDLKVFQQPALPTPLAITFEGVPHQPPIDSLPQLSGSDLLRTSVSRGSRGFAGETPKKEPLSPKTSL